MCTSFIDSLKGALPHFERRPNLVVVAKSAIGRIRYFARGRGWTHLRLLSFGENSYNRDYHAESADGGQLPSFNVFAWRAGKVRHFLPHRVGVPTGRSRPESTTHRYALATLEFARFYFRGSRHRLVPKAQLQEVKNGNRGPRQTLHNFS
jgi:predicted dithiol-disulfide oxidoreductase (DUF899 family)